MVADEASRRLSPAAQEAIARYRRLMGNVADPEPGEGPTTRDGGDLERHLAERPPHWAPPRGERPVRPDDDA